MLTVVEVESINRFGSITMNWGDMFEIEVFAAVTAEHGWGCLGRPCLGRDRGIFRGLEAYRAGSSSFPRPDAL